MPSWNYSARTSSRSRKAESALRVAPTVEAFSFRLVSECIRLLGCKKHVAAARDIGAMALRELQALDHVAYLRFASVYHAVGSPEDFLEVIKPLLDGR